jgi:integrator complex subunit 3
MWQIATPHEHIVSLLAPEIEAKFWFLLHQVPHKLHLVYLGRLKSRYFDNGTETLYADVIRYICVIVHPTNDVLRSEVVQRWLLIRSMFSSIKVPFLSF